MQTQSRELWNQRGGKKREQDNRQDGEKQKQQYTL